MNTIITVALVLLAAYVIVRYVLPMIADARADYRIERMIREYLGK